MRTSWASARRRRRSSGRRRTSSTAPRRGRRPLEHLLRATSRIVMRDTPSGFSAGEERRGLKRPAPSGMRRARRAGVRVRGRRGCSAREVGVGGHGRSRRRAAQAASGERLA
jgi:hypothetical protein